MVSRCEPFDTLDHSSDQIFAGLDVTCFLVYLPGNHIYPCGGFLSSIDNRVTDPWFRQ